MKQNVDVAAYIWPAYTGKEPRTRIFWPEGIGEWETVKAARPKFEGHAWPRVPLLGYQDEAEPVEMEKQINVALSHGVNVFIYDWYWFDRRPYLEQCLNEGYLKAKNSSEMKFYLLWANHDAYNVWDRRIASEPYGGTVIWQGKTTPSDFDEIVVRWLDQYFTLGNYYKVDGKPLVSIYDLANFVATFGSVDKTREAMLRANEKAKEYGLPGIHFQVISWGKRVMNLSGVDGSVFSEELISMLPFESVSNYQYVHLFNINRDFADTTEDAVSAWNYMKDSIGIKYYPHVSIGWDNNPRHKVLMPNILKNNTPEQFRKHLELAKEFAERTDARMVTVNSWNEWTEGSYLLPDDLNGYGYLEAVRDVFLEK